MPGAPVLRRRLRESLGGALFDRLLFLPKQTPQALQRLFTVSDVVLDSPYYAGSLTSYDAFTCGIPVVTLPGTLAVQSYTAGLYRRMELDGFSVPTNSVEYIAATG